MVYPPVRGQGVGHAALWVRRRLLRVGTWEAQSLFSRVAIVNRGEAAMRLIHAVRDLSAEAGTPVETVALYTDADRTATDYIHQLGPQLLLDPHVYPSRDPQDPNSVRVQVTATVPPVFPLPGFSFKVDETSQGPVERFVPDNGG